LKLYPGYWAFAWLFK